MQASRLLLLSRRNTAPREFLDLFRNGQKGGIWLPSLTKSLFQDAAMTIPAAVGMPVIKALDLSGNGNTMTFANVTLERDSAGLLYLSANGTSSTGQTAAIDFSGSDEMTVIAGIHKASDAAAGVFAELSASTATNAGSFLLLAPGTAAANFGFNARGVNIPSQMNVSGHTAPISRVVTAQADISADSRIVRINGSATSDATDMGAGNFGNHVLYLFARAAASSFFNGRMYGLVVRGATATAGQVVDGERAMARLSGVNF